MLQGKTLRGRAVVDLDAAEKIGNLAELVLDPASRRVAGLIVSHRRSVFSGRRQIVLPAVIVYAVGPDAITVRRLGDAGFEMWQLSGLPRLSQITGLKVVSFSGKLLGVTTDVLIDPADGRIIGYPLGSGRPTHALERWLAGETGQSRPDYVRADADLRIGSSMIMVPDDAVVRAGESAPAADEAAERLPARAAASWSDYVLDVEAQDGWDAPDEGVVPEGPGQGGLDQPAGPAVERAAAVRPVAYRDGFTRDGRIA
jgi:sporulation protein YlmC with PRC-barrel domain